MKRSPFPIWLVPVLAAIALLAVFLIWRSGSTPQSDSPRSVSAVEASQLVEQGAMLIDVREPNEWQSFHAPNATLIPLGELSSHVSSLPKDRPIVVVCHSGNRSRQAQNTLLKAGFTDVINLSGGMVSWQQSGLPTVSGQ